ncbi:hypothetical protein LUX12_16230 [Streptomyces somaliensis]|uniref:hypothetical protein n=1 Tax=Streptomyces somaliensis TaxID=78355 RepID=UPI0020CCF95A|nr:hypothetical protein [Streptomyces somaliensis]MCP9945990.1 hypothetical protein [Streptomyces somaliensis]MCP9960843.1 hypothetical protein [Streptomyces somaliensis]MCP9973627.1 hypothetical protein [Streptomyces somaliensis]
MKRTSAAPRLVPYITQREGEYGGLESELTLSMSAFGAVRLAYQDETPADRGPRGELWARCSQSLNAAGKPTGKPQWRMVNPTRQREAMEQLSVPGRLLPGRDRPGLHLPRRGRGRRLPPRW